MMILTKQKQSAIRKRSTAAIAMAFLISVTVAPVSTAAADINQMSQFVGLMQNFFVLMDSMYEAASNPEHAALLQMNSLEDLYKASGNLREMVVVYRDIIEKSTNPTVRRLERMRLADALKETGQMTEAIEVLKHAINETVEQANRQ